MSREKRKRNAFIIRSYIKFLLLSKEVGEELDNMSLSKMREVVNMLNGKVLVEVSGNIRLSNVSKIADLGVDFISVGALTHSYKSLDISMEFIN